MSYHLPASFDADRMPKEAADAFPCEKCDSLVTAETEVQCQFCGSFHCCECDLSHYCGSTNTCTACDKRFNTEELRLTPCRCDDELCPKCYAAHICPPTLSEAMDSALHDLAESMVH